jgi:hypothetical protein
MNGLGGLMPHGERDSRDSAWKKPSALSKNNDVFMGVDPRTHALGETKRNGHVKK